MIFALPFPDISPEIFSIEIGGFSFALRWYALAYIAGLLIGLWIVRQTLARTHLWRDGKPPMTAEQADALLTWVIVGVILGGRLGFVLFYQPAYYWQNPGDILKVWQGGMSFHGGLLGVIVASALFRQRHGLPAVSLTDVLTLAAPPGLLFGRLANFINGELWGRATHVPWAMEFPDMRAQICPEGWIGACTRHPSQLYEAILEGLVLGGVMLFLAYRREALKAPGRIAGIFFLGYGMSRFFVELFRQADAQFVTPDNIAGYALQFGGAGLTMGQVLSLPMMVVGVLLILRARSTARG